MEKVEAYKTSDGKKFFEESEAQSHENKLSYKSRVGDIGNYLFDLLKIKKLNNNEEGRAQEEKEEQFFDMLKAEDTSSLGDLMENIDEDLKEVIAIIISFATLLDGALLKTAQYAKEIVAPKER